MNLGEVLTGFGMGFNQAVPNVNTMGGIMDRQDEMALRKQHQALQYQEMVNRTKEAADRRRIEEARLGMEQERFGMDKANWAFENTPNVVPHSFIEGLTQEGTPLFGRRQQMLQDAMGFMQPDVKTGMWTRKQLKELREYLKPKLHEYVLTEHGNSIEESLKEQIKLAKANRKEHYEDVLKKTKEKLYGSTDTLLGNWVGHEGLEEYAKNLTQKSIKEETNAIQDKINTIEANKQKLGSIYPEILSAMKLQAEIAKSTQEARFAGAQAGYVEGGREMTDNEIYLKAAQGDPIAIKMLKEKRATMALLHPPKEPVLNEKIWTIPMPYWIEEPQKDPQGKIIPGTGKQGHMMVNAGIINNKGMVTPNSDAYLSYVPYGKLNPAYQRQPQQPSASWLDIGIPKFKMKAFNDELGRLKEAFKAKFSEYPAEEDLLATAKDMAIRAGDKRGKETMKLIEEWKRNNGSIPADNRIGPTIDVSPVPSRPIMQSSQDLGYNISTSIPNRGILPEEYRQWQKH